MGNIFNITEKIAEAKIKEAFERGEFDNLPGQGQPLDLEDYSRIPEDLRMAYTVLKNANVLPPEVQLKNEIVQIEDMLASIKDEQEKYRQIKKLNFLVMKLNTMKGGSVVFEEHQHYYEKMVSRMTVPPKKEKDGGDG